MNILIITDTHVPHLGGKSSHICDLIDGVFENGSSAYCISASSVKNGLKNFTRFKKIFIYPVKWFNKYTYSRLSITITDNAIKKLAKDYLNHHSVDIISAQDPISALKAYELVGDKIPIVLTMHSYFGKGMEEPSEKNIKKSKKHFSIIEKRDTGAIKILKGIVGVDERIKDDCNEYAVKMGCSIPVISISNFVNTNKYRPSSAEEKAAAKKELGIPEDKKVAICIRRLCDKNGVIYAVKAMEKVENAVLLVGGDGPNMQEIRQYVEEHSLGDKVRLLGGVDGKLKDDVYKAADFAIVPSITVNGLQEATSISAIEAMAFGLVLIASDIGGLKQLVTSGENGYLVKEQDSDEIALKLNELCGDETTLNRIKNNAVNSVLENYSHVAGSKKYMDFYKEIISD